MSERKAVKAKPRALPFSDLEIAVLMSCLDQWKSIIECVETDAWSLQTKKEAWEHVADEYQEICLKNKVYKERTVEQLKTCWKNVKAKVRKIDSEEKTESMLTGGGPEHKVSEEDQSLSAMVHHIKPTIDFTLENKFDSTSAFEETVDLTIDDSSFNYENNDESQNLSVDELEELIGSTNDLQTSLQVADLESIDESLALSQIMEEKRAEREARKQNLMNEMDKRKGALARPKGFCRPSQASYKNKSKPAIPRPDEEIPSTSKSQSTHSEAAPTKMNFSSLLGRRGVTAKMTTSQKLGERMRVWEANFQNTDHQGDVKPSVNTSSGILSNCLKKCQENADPEDPQLLLTKKGRLQVAQSQQNERTERAEECKKQQAEFHQGRMEILELEKRYWSIKIEIVNSEKELQAAKNANESLPNEDSP